VKDPEVAHDEQPATRLYWLEQPVCLEWPKRHGERSEPLRRYAPSLLGALRTLTGALRSKLARGKPRSPSARR